MTVNTPTSTHWVFRITDEPRNHRDHPMVLGVLYLYCPAAAYWHRAGVASTAPWHPVWQAVKDYGSDPEKTLRDYLKTYEVDDLRDEARRYVEQVTAARQRLAHIASPELLPTFPGGKMPLRRKFNVSRPLQKMGGDQGFFAYVRTWAFVIGDWTARLPYSGLRLRWGVFPAMVQGMQKPIWLPAIYWQRNTEITPLVIGVPSNLPPALQALYFFVQSPTKTPWQVQPQIWALQPDGLAHPLDSRIVPLELTQAIIALGRRAMKVRTPLPLASMRDPGAVCAACPFAEVCFIDATTGAGVRWTPQAGAFMTVAQGERA